MKLLDVIYEDDDLLVINKPAGLVCHPTKMDECSSLIGRVRLYLRFDSKHSDLVSIDAKPGNQIRPAKKQVRPLREPSAPHLVNRLDRETSGVVLAAKNAEAAGELGKLIENRVVEKEYVALVHGRVRENHGIIDAPLGKDERSKIAIKDCVRPDGAPARTEFWLEAVSSPAILSEGSLLRLRPHTGRKHQIRIHLAHIGHAIVGDKLYGGDEDLYLALVQNRLTPEQLQKLVLPNHALHAQQVRFTWRERERVFRAEAPNWFQTI